MSGQDAAAQQHQSGGDPGNEAKGTGAGEGTTGRQDAAAAAASSSTGTPSGQQASQQAESTRPPIMSPEVQQHIAGLTREAGQLRGDLKKAQRGIGSRDRQITALERKLAGRASSASDDGGDGKTGDQDVLAGFERDDDGHVLGIGDEPIPEGLARELVTMRGDLSSVRNTQTQQALADLEADYQEAIEGVETAAVASVAGMVDRRFGPDLPPERKVLMATRIAGGLRSRFQTLVRGSDFDPVEHLTPEVAIRLTQAAFDDEMGYLGTVGGLQAASNQEAATEQPVAAGGVGAQTAAKPYADLTDAEKREHTASLSARIRQKYKIPIEG